eukprot:COSAG01_NODE_3711_length_5769_cov_10.210545_4_plen_73_part_00
MVLHEPVPTKLAASVVGGSAAGLAERLRRVGLAEDSVGALCQVVSVGDVKEGEGTGGGGQGREDPRVRKPLG